MELFSTLDGMLCDNKLLRDLDKKDITPVDAKEVQEIFDEINKKVRKKIGDKDYEKLEQYLIGNKDNRDLKDVIGYLLEDMILDVLVNSPLLIEENSVKQEIIVGYKLSLKLYELLEESGYDAETALLTIWDEAYE